LDRANSSMASLSTWIASSEDNTYRYKPLLNLYYLFLINAGNIRALSTTTFGRP
jgi:hypothetical protein